MAGNSQKKPAMTLPSDALSEEGVDSKRAGKAGRKAGARKSASVPATEEGPVVKNARKPRKGAAPQVGQSTQKPKVVRDSFTMPEHDYGKLAELKRKCLAGGVQVKKSELLRAGLRVLDALSQERLLSVVAQVEAVKTGRPAKR